MVVHLIFDEHVEEVFAWALDAAGPTAVSEAGQGEVQLGEVADAGPLVVQTLALRAGDQLEQLLGLGPQQAGVPPGAGPLWEGALPGGSGGGASCRRAELSTSGASLGGSGAGASGASVWLWE